ncbi:hypothetical protein DFH08DRAFT_811068 [Mycena albidolilacea]|uniref:Uncharacterized protein n=1 Tax=Mycena albidolilacea TaxID=1033008 RepID=A0AAD6ZW05_9AGAR|nr:hypothetical protein DFH08DRAFT_811068 [Mycena albidolilacea]
MSAIPRKKAKGCGTATHHTWNHTPHYIVERAGTPTLSVGTVLLRGVVSAGRCVCSSTAHDAHTQKGIRIRARRIFFAVPLASEPILSSDKEADKQAKQGEAPGRFGRRPRSGTACAKGREGLAQATLHAVHHPPEKRKKKGKDLEIVCNAQAPHTTEIQVQRRRGVGRSSGRSVLSVSSHLENENEQTKAKAVAERRAQEGRCAAASRKQKKERESRLARIYMEGDEMGENALIHGQHNINLCEGYLSRELGERGDVHELAKELGRDDRACEAEEH